MSSDIKLDGDTLTLEGNWTKVMSWDLHLDGPGRRSSSAGQRRALVHDSGDALTINYNGDYPAGVRIKGNVDFAGDLTAHKNLSVAADLSIGDDASVGDDLTVGGVITVDGVRIQKTSEGLLVGDVLIEVTPPAVVTPLPTTPGRPTVGRVDPSIRPELLKPTRKLVLKKDTVVVKTYSPMHVIGSPTATSVLDLVAEVEALRKELDELKAKVAALGG